MTLFPKTILYYSSTGSYINGIWVNTDVPSTFTGSVQPLTGKALEALNVGRKDVGKVQVFSNSQLKVSLQGVNQKGDVVVWKGQKFELIAELIQQNDLINHYEYVGEYVGQA